MDSETINRARGFLGDEEGLEGGQRIGRYEIVREIARGGMATVCEARDPELGRSVALKILKDEGTAERLRREAMVVANLRHENIVTVHEVGPDFIAMELVSGATLATRLKDMDRERRLAVIETVARAAGFAHRHGVIHRDIKPENILIADDGRVVLTDFGLARGPDHADLSRSKHVLGTPHYMAPEQVRGESDDIGPASDVWGLGVLLYQAISDRKPFDGATIPGVFDQIVRHDPEPISGELGAIVAKALEKDSKLRYQRADLLADDLGRYLRGESVQARPSRAGHRLWRRMSRRPLPYLLNAGLVLAVATAVALGVRGERERRDALDSIREQARISLEAALVLRRAGSVSSMRRFLPPLEAAYKEAVRRSPDLAEIDYLMGRMHRALLEEKRAMKYQEQAIRKDPRFAPAIYERAVLLSLDHARQSSRARAIAAEPESVRLADVEHARPDLARLRTKATAAWKAFLAVTPAAEPPRALLGRGFLAYQADDLPSARTAIEAAVKADPSLDEGWEALTHVVSQVSASAMQVETSGLEQAEALLNERIASDQGYVPLLIQRAELRWKRGRLERQRGLSPLRNYRGALEDFSRVTELLPRSVQGWTGQGRVHTYFAMAALEIDVDPRSECSAAEQALTRALELNPKHSPAQLYRGVARFTRAKYLRNIGQHAAQEFVAAERDLDETLRFNPDYTPVFGWRGWVRVCHAEVYYGNVDDPIPLLDGAAEDFARAAADLKSDGPRFAETLDRMYQLTQRSNVPTQLALAMIARKQDPQPYFAAAVKLIDEALQQYPDFGEAWMQKGAIDNHRARYLDSRGKREESARLHAAAAVSFTEAVTINPRLHTHFDVRFKQSLSRAHEQQAK